MTTSRQYNVTKYLRRLSRELSGSESDPYFKPSEPDLEGAKYWHTLAERNDRGLLDTTEANDVLEMFEGHHPVIREVDGRRWVEADETEA